MMTKLKKSKGEASLYVCAKLFGMLSNVKAEYWIGFNIARIFKINLEPFTTHKKHSIYED